MKQQLLLISLTIFFLKSSFSLECLKANELKKVKNTQDFCINHSVYKIISKNCLGNINCQAINSYINFNASQKIRSSKAGNPLHKKCQIIGGSPQFVDYLYKGNTEQSAVCFFTDGSFISVFNEI